MESRFRHHQLLDQVTFIEAIPRSSPLVDFYQQGLPEVNYNQTKRRGEIACYASHLKAIRQFLHDGGDTALICEDDILLHNEFRRRYGDTMTNLPNGIPLITLCYMMNAYDGCHWTGIDSDRHDLMTIDSINTWGAQMYYLTKDYAMRILSDHDRPFGSIKNTEITSEAIIRQSNGLMTYPPMVIEDGIDSDREPGDLPYHHPHFKFWGYSNYCSGEKEHLSPLNQD